MPLNIALLNDSFPPVIDGVANATYNYADLLTRNHNCRCTVITPRYPNIVDHYPFHVVRYQSVKTLKRIGYRAGNPIDIKTINRLRRLQFDLVHVHCPFVSALVGNEMVMSLRRKAPIVFTYHTKFGIDIDNRFKGESFRALAKKFVIRNINRSNEVWVVSQGAGEDLRQLGYQGGYRVMENGTDFPRTPPTPAIREKFNREHNLTADDLVLLFVGRMTWVKNFRLMLDGLKMAMNAGLAFRAFFVGDGYDLPEIAQYAQRLGLAGRVLFPGKILDRDKLKEYFCRADLFLFPSTYDTSGLVVKEAAACSCPSLLVRNSCASEGVEDGFSGYLCEENVPDFTHVLLTATADRTKLREVGENASRHIYLSWEDAVSKAYNRYIEIVEAWPHALPYRDRDPQTSGKL